MGRLFTSESVTEGHPDKIADQISDAILDALIREDPNSRVAAETTVATGLALVVGEISTNAYVGYLKGCKGYHSGDWVIPTTKVDLMRISIAVLTSI